MAKDATAGIGTSHCAMSPSKWHPQFVQSLQEVNAQNWSLNQWTCISTFDSKPDII